MVEVRNYFQSYEGYFWQWEDGDEVIAIPNSSTIAYKEFVIELLEKLSGQGIPPFGSVLLALIATNPGGETLLNEVYALLDNRLGTMNSTREPLTSAIAFLKLLAQLPSKYKKGRNRILLLQTLFAGCHNSLSELNSKHVLDFYKAYKFKEEDFLEKKAFFLNVYNNEFRVISLLARRFPDARSILEKMADLPEVEEQLELETEVGTEPSQKDFVETLIESDQTFHVGALIRRLWSGLNIPYHNNLPSQQPMGGVSDLTNKGEFDRLLISEYANDDLVFLSRLANHEALYINREIPPQDNDLERVILIDVSIRSWGTPKTLAHALMLAIVKHPKTNIHCSAFAVGESYQPLDYSSIDDIIDGLQVLEPCLHPGRGLELFFKEYGSKKKAEVFFISSSDTYRNDGLHKVVSDHYSLFNYWIQIDSLGNIDLYKRQQNSKKHVQHLCLPLEELWKREPRASFNHDSGKGSCYPIRFPGAPNPKKILSEPSGAVLQITAERSLFQSFVRNGRQEKGWELISENLSFINGEAAFGITSGGKHLLLLFNLQDRQITIMNLNGGDQKTAFFHEWRTSVYPQFVFYKDRFYYSYLGYPSRHWTFELEEGIVINSFENIPKEILDLHKEKEIESRHLFTKGVYPGTVLKNVTSIFINEVGNLVLNIHELRLTDHNVIKLEKTGFKKKYHEAVSVSKTEFRFEDGSTVMVNRSGMLVLRSSNPSIPAIYVPLSLDGSLGVATESDFAGNAYYQLKSGQGRLPVCTKRFWDEYMDPFIDNIKNYGTQVKAL
jgi:hypothetical protein